MIKTFEELFEKMEADGRRSFRAQSVYKDLQEYRAGRKSGAILEDSELRKILYRKAWIDGYLDCLREEEYISPKECEGLCKTLQPKNLQPM